LKSILLALALSSVVFIGVSILSPSPEPNYSELSVITSKFIKEAGSDGILDVNEQHNFYSEFKLKVSELNKKFNCDSITIKEIEQFKDFSRMLISVEKHRYVETIAITVDNSKKDAIEKSVKQIAYQLEKLCKG